MKIYDCQGTPLTIGNVIGRGGEAVVYRINDRPTWLAKIYEPAPRPNYADKLAWMVEHPPSNPTHSINHSSLAWPVELLYGPGNQLAGYLMPYIQQAVPVLVVFNPRRRTETLAQFDRRYLHRAARNLASAVGTLHASGYVVGDLNESNVLVTTTALVTLIDTDSFQVQKPNGSQVVTYACPVGKQEYTPPELQGKALASTVRSYEQDAFSLGVLIFQLLMEGNHPFRAQWLGKGDPPPIEERIALGGFPYTSAPGVPVQPPKYAPDLDLLHPEISELIRRCFIDGHLDPRLRPEASAWERAIAKAEKSLVQCPNQHYFSDHLRSCPVCHAPRAPAGRTAWQTGQVRRPEAPSPKAGSNPPAGQPAAASTTRSSSAPPAGKPTSQQRTTTSSQTYTSKRTASTSAGAGAPSGSSARPKPGNTTSSGRPAGKTSSSRPASGPANRPFTGNSVSGGIKQAQQVWELLKYWQAQQIQVQQSGLGTNPFGSRRARQAMAAWNTWKYWQTKQTQAQQPAPKPPQAAQPAQPKPARPAAQAQPPPGGPKAAQNTNYTSPPGPSSAPQAHQPGAYSAQSQPNKQTQTSQGQQAPPPPRPKPPRPAPAYARSQPGRPVYARPSTTAAQTANKLLNWAGPRMYKSLAIGGGLGALAGALPGALVGVGGWIAGSMASWVLLWALGGATAGLLRGWQPGYQMSQRIEKAVGWKRVWPAFGVLAGAGLGGFIGLALGWWAVFPVFVGLVVGAWLGHNAGRKLWQAGTRVGWERIWAGLGALGAALLGWQLAAWLGAGSFSIQMANSFSTWITGQSASLALVAVGVGALGGALGGAVAGTLADLFARMFNLLD
jgi:serine/threonine protein kinase